MAGGFADLKNDAGLPLVEGIVASVSGNTFTLRLPGTHYEPKFTAVGAAPAVDAKAAGIVRAKARRIDLPSAGGRFVEPVAGRPRRIQGRVIGVDAAKNEIQVRAGFALVATPLAPQKASDFAVGQTVSFDAEPGATFEVSAPAHHH